MARVRVCRFCNHRNAAAEIFCCECRASLEGIEISDNVGGTDQGALQADAAGDVEDNRAEEVFRDHVSTAREPQAAEVQVATLECPWGCVEMRGSLSIGRDADYSSESEKFGNYMTVSAIHAVIFLSGPEWFVRDVGSTNGTFVNGVQSQANENVALHDGDQVHFSQSLVTIFRMGRVET